MNHDSPTPPGIYSYASQVLQKFPDLPARLSSGRLVPDQVEVHLPPRGTQLCWLNCPHCFTHLGRDNRTLPLSLDRLCTILDQIAHGHPETGERPEKLILGGFNTDPLNSAYVMAVVRKVRSCGFLLGIHTKGLRASDELIQTLVAPSRPDDYISFSVDAGSDEVFNAAHGLNGRAKLYTAQKYTIRRLVEARMHTQSGLSIAATYLITSLNASQQEIRRFADDMLGLGVDRVRFSEPIVPVMGREDRTGFPKASCREVDGIRSLILALQKSYPDRIHFLDFSAPRPVRTLPCCIRWLQPTIGFDGYLYPCCLTASDQFASLRLANLADTDFWPAYAKDVKLDFRSANCQCDRKAMAINFAVGKALRHDLPKQPRTLAGAGPGVSPAYLPSAPSGPNAVTSAAQP